MKTLLLVITAIFVLSLPTLAGPLTGAPAIKFEVGAAEAATPGTWGLGLGYTTFNFTIAVPGFGEESYANTGAIVSAEYSKPLAEGKSLTFGGWVSPTSGDLDDLTMGEIHGRYNFNPNWGIEVGRLLFDAGASDGGLGTFMAHAVYQTQSTSEKPLKAQIGLGVLQGSFDVPGLAKIGMGGSFFANVSYPVSENWSGYAAVWSLFQELDFDASTGVPDSSFSTIQWSIGASRSF